MGKIPIPLKAVESYVGDLLVAGIIEAAELGCNGFSSLEGLTQEIR